jgi:hypothetical protein
MKHINIQSTKPSSSKIELDLNMNIKPLKIETTDSGLEDISDITEEILQESEVEIVESQLKNSTNERELDDFEDNELKLKRELEKYGL